MVMAATGRTPVPPNSRIRFAHHVIELGDGRRIGVSVGGDGVPLIFFHGIGMNRRVYMKLLSRLPQLGFLVVAIDAPWHGETFAPTIGEHTFAHRIAITERILEGLGIERAVLVGHSMGGRTAAELAARHPERDTIVDRVGLRRRDQVRYMRTLSKLFFYTPAHPATFASAARAIARADDSATALKALRRADTRVVIFHGEQDKIVPLASAVDAARLSGALLVTLPKAYHSWVLNTPWTLAEILSRLSAENRLGGDLRSATSSARRGAGPDSGGMYRPDALVHDLTPQISVLGSAYPQRRRMYPPVSNLGSGGGSGLCSKCGRRD